MLYHRVPSTQLLIRYSDIHCICCKMYRLATKRIYTEKTRVFSVTRIISKSGEYLAKMWEYVSLLFPF